MYSCNCADRCCINAVAKDHVANFIALCNPSICKKLFVEKCEITLALKFPHFTLYQEFIIYIGRGLWTLAYTHVSIAWDLRFFSCKKLWSNSSSTCFNLSIEARQTCFSSPPESTKTLPPQFSLLPFWCATPSYLHETFYSSCDFSNILPGKTFTSA